MDRRQFLENPYRPGAGHFPPLLAGRIVEQNHFKRALRERHPSENFLITGLRGFGKTVLLDRLRDMAEDHGWIWVGNDLSESASLSEERLALRVLTDLSEAISSKLGSKAQCDGEASSREPAPLSADDFGREQHVFDALKGVYENSPGLPSDRLKAVISRAGSLAARARASGLILSYDEAQCLRDHADRNEFPMSMLVETVQSLQRRPGVVPVLLLLSGLPHVQDALTDTRTYTERMFHILTLDRLSREETWAALATPLDNLMPPLHASKELIDKVVDLSGGYPYLIQFFGKELVDKLLENGGTLQYDAFPAADTLERLDAGLFGARWSRTTDKQREILGLLANRGANAAREITASEVAELSEGETSNAQATQHLQALCERGLLYRTRYGRYAFTVPMSEAMILRRLRTEQEVEDSWQLAAIKDDKAKSKRWSWFR
ncbi:MAG: hypothetical protein AB7O43_16525 [Hyphomicrobiaceae bacterium]